MSGNNPALVLVNTTNSGVAGTAGNGTITAGTSDGSTSQISTGQSNGLSNGTMSLGCVESGGQINAQAYGTLSVGHATNSAIIATELDGSTVHGRADGIQSSIPSQISGSGVGSEASGHAITGGVIGSTGTASKAFGDVSSNGTVYSSGDASLAFGNAISGDIESSGQGSLAFGVISTAGSKVLASGISSMAFGEAGNGYNVEATSDSALAFGVALNNSITASAQGALAGGFPLAGAVLASGVASIAFGDKNITTARLGTALGLGNENDSYSSLMIGAYGSTSGCTAGSWVSTDALFVAGNGSSSGGPSNAYHLAKDGRTTTTAAERHISIRLASGTTTISSRIDRTLACDTSGSVVIANLPAAEDGLEYYILDAKNNAMAHNITINCNGTDTFQGGGASETINTNDGCRHIQALGGVWYILNRS